MATRKEIKCINKRGSHYDAHKRIEHVGGVYAGLRWKLSETAAIAKIDSKTEEYFVTVDGKAVNVIVSKHGTDRYLKTENDGYAPNNLLSLPECP